MGYPILKTSDFVGFFDVSQNKFTKVDLEAYILKYEHQYLEEMLGCDLAALLIADLDIVTNIPITQRFLDIWNSFCDDTFRCTCLFYRSTGIKDMLKSFVYFHFVRDQFQKNTIAGNVVAKSEVSTQLDYNTQQGNTNERYNNGVKTFRAIQSKVSIENTTYPEFKGWHNHKELIFFL